MPMSATPSATATGSYHSIFMILLPQGLEQTNVYNAYNFKVENYDAAELDVRRDCRSPTSSARRCRSRSRSGVASTIIYQILYAATVAVAGTYPATAT